MPALKNVIYYVSGGASGLGLATVEALHAKGAYVSILDLNSDLGNKVVTRLGPQRTFFAKCDVRSESDVEEAIRRTEAKWPDVKTAGVVNAGGIARAQPLVSMKGEPANLEAFKQVIDVNLTGSFNLSSKVSARIVRSYPPPKAPSFPANIAKGQDVPDEVPNAVAEDRGCIILTSSVAFQDGQNGQSSYAASKGGVASLVLPMARDLSRFGIRAVAIAPSMFSTAMVAQLPAKAKINLLLNTVFPPRAGKAEEFAHLVLAILENPMLNGTVIRLDGATRMGKL